MVFLETERLIIRNVKPKDVNIMHDYRNNEACSRYQRGQTKDYDGIVDLIDRRKNDVINDSAPFFTAIALKNTDDMVGEIVVIPKGEYIFMGYTVSYKHHRKGYAYEALSAIIDKLHSLYPGKAFICLTERENAPSIALLKKLGYKYMGYSPSITSEVFSKWASAEYEKFIIEDIGITE